MFQKMLCNSNALFIHRFVLFTSVGDICIKYYHYRYKWSCTYLHTYGEERLNGLKRNKQADATTFIIRHT